MKNLDSIPKVERQALIDNNIALTKLLTERLRISTKNGSKMPVPLILLSMTEKVHQLLGVAVSIEFDKAQGDDEEANWARSIASYCAETALHSLKDSLPMEMSIVKGLDETEHKRIQAAIKLARSPRI
jgi:hypothetical protein